ncbi:gephyrin-like molybdotransferase Glp [Chloroflexota bacterium]
MKPFGELLPFEEAKRIIETNVKLTVRVEAIDIDYSLGRVLAEDIVATLNIPPYDRAAMDGYAVKAEDTSNASQSNPKVLKIISELYAGETPQKGINTGECIQIATGAMMPEGADAVVKVEDTKAENGKVKVFKPVSPKENRAEKGEDIKEGEPVLRHGFVLDAGKIGVLASQGISQIRAYEKPKVAIIPTGEEIGEVGQNLKQGQVYDINSHTIASVVRGNGGTPVSFGVVGDDLEQLKTTIKEALKNDLVVISAGSSVGERDLLSDVLQNWGEVLFHGVRIKPGMPTLFGKINSKLIFGMPGFPTSCLVTTQLFVAPAIRKMARLSLKRMEVIKAKLSRGVPSTLGRKQFFTVRLEGDTAIPVYKESGNITSMSYADGYIEIAENIESVEKGEPITVTLF